jgi:hypothetical protein
VRSLRPTWTSCEDRLRSTCVRPLAGLRKLEGLIFAGARVKDLAPLAGLTGLESLDLFGCRPAVPARLLRSFADLPSLSELVADEATGVPREVLSLDCFDNCLPRLRAYLSGTTVAAV